MTSSVSRAGGVDRYFFNLMRAMPDDGLRQQGLVAGDPALLGDAPGVRSFASDGDAMPVKWMKMRKTGAPLVDESDVVVSHFAPYAFPVIDRIKKRPFVVHFHGPWALESRAEGAGATAVAVKRRIEQTVYGAASRVIVLSEAFAEIAAREYGVAERTIRVIPGGVDLSRFGTDQTRDAARERLGWPAGRPTVATVRRLVQAKGVENLIAAAVELRRRIPDVFVAIVGTGPLAETLARQIVDLGLEHTVRMVGHVSECDLPSVYRAADLFVVPTIALEGFGLVVVEALASGTPTLVTPIGGLPAVVRDLDRSLVLDGCEPEHLARGIARALAGERRVPSEAECVAYARRFSWGPIARDVKSVYREVEPLTLFESSPRYRRGLAPMPSHSF